MGEGGGGVLFSNCYLLSLIATKSEGWGRGGDGGSGFETKNKRNPILTFVS